MSRRSFGLMLLLLGLAATVAAQAPAPGDKPIWSHAHDVRVRKGGMAEFNKDSPQFGIEFFKDPLSQTLLAISQTGQLAAVPLGTLGTKAQADAIFAHDLRVRKSTEDKFTKDTGKFGVEVFKDGPSGKLLYVSENGSIALAHPPANLTTDRGPMWHHGFVLKVRSAGEEKFSKTTKAVSLEAFRDDNTGGLIYITETLAIAASPSSAPAPMQDKVQDPVALYGLTLRVRGGDELTFSDKTKKLGVEVFSDPNSGDLIYLTETGSIAVLPSAPPMETGQGVTWKHAFSLKARAGGQKDFTQAKKYGIEVFQDNNTKAFLFISDAGGIAVRK